MCVYPSCFFSQDPDRQHQDQSHPWHPHHVCVTSSLTQRWTEHTAFCCPSARSGTSHRTGDMLGQRRCDHCTDFCDYTDLCSNHGDGVENRTALHYGHCCGSDCADGPRAQA
uniref:Uncharacterized protein n=1 Tax=Knipowitschia caucasica TaxID=637954 RepID=A0AAV2KZD7_KNICA